MQPVDTQPQRFTQPFDLYAHVFAERSVKATEIAANRQEQKDITIYTDEGDKVTISLEGADQLVYSEYQGRSRHVQALKMQNVAAVQMQSVNVEQKTIEFDRQRAFTITVEGDLSDQELEDIKTALQKIDSLMTDILYEGDFSEMAETTSDLRDLESLAGIEAAYNIDTRVAVQQTKVQENAQLIREEAPIIARRGRGFRGMPGRRFVDDLVKIVKHADIKPRMILRPLKALFKDYSEHLETEKHAGKPHHDWIREIREDLFDKIESED